MTCISRQTVGKYTYLYESVSFRDQNGRPRNKKVSIGKIDPVTGKPVFKKEYLERMAAAGTPIEQESPLHSTRILRDSKEYTGFQ